MPALLATSLLLVAIAIGVAGRPRGLLIVLTTTWLLVPGSVRVPGAGDGHLFIHRVVVLAVLIGLLRAVRSGRIPRTAFAVRGVHAAFAAFLVVALLAGVVLAEAGVASNLNVNAYLALVDQALFFGVALAVFRAAGARTSAVAITAVAGAVAAIGISERLFSWSYSRWFVRDLSDASGLLSLELARRGPHERIRGAATFALEYGWVLALLLPLAVAVALTARRHGRVAWAVPVALGVCMVSTWSRSAYAGLAVGLGVLALGMALDRPRQALPLGVVGLGLATLALQGPLREALDVGVTGGEQDVRFERLPEILGLVSSRPVIGLGLGGLLDNRVSVVDISWVTTYATLGVIGVVALAVVLLSASHAASRFVLCGPSPTRTIAAGAAGAVVAAPLGYASYDLGTLRMSTATVFGLAALALAANEELGVLPVPAVRRGYLVPVSAVALGVLGLVAGLATAFSVPAVSTVDSAYLVADPRRLAEAPTHQRYTTKVLSQTACLVVDAGRYDAKVRCQDLDQVAGATGTLRVEASSDEVAERVQSEVAARLDDAFPAAVVSMTGRGSGRPTWASTAPLWMAAVGFAVGAAAPDRVQRPVRGAGGGLLGSGPAAPGPPPLPPRRPNTTG